MSDDFEPESELEPEPPAEPASENEPEPEFEPATEPAGEVGKELESELDEDSAPEPSPVKLERLQKILAQAGVASRRHAEQLIVEGRVQVNGVIVTELGSKADPTRDHIRVDGKLIHGAERLRYFMLNKPKGYVTTVSDPEGRPTVMQFFEKTRERVFPVGRLDYESEGLLLMTNDGELANQLTRAASGVEKTYLVKVSGQPAEEELDRLREGVRIDRRQPGEGKVHTAPAQIRRVRQGDNPWFEVVLIEGRNRELRKMFQEIGHYVEKIRRVGYGPLVLDIEPGKVRELDLDEIAALRRAAEGKHKPVKPRESKRQDARSHDWADSGKRPMKRAQQDNRENPRRDAQRAERPFRGREGRPSPGGDRRSDRPARADRPRVDRPGDDRSGFTARPSRRDDRGGGRTFAKRSAPPFREREGRPSADRPRTGRPRPSGDRPSGRPARAGRPGDDRSGSTPRPLRSGEAGTQRSFSPKPTWRGESRAPAGPRRPPREMDRERFSGERFSDESRRRFAKPESPRGPGSGPRPVRRPASDRPRTTERSRDEARDNAKRGFPRREPSEGFRDKPGKPDSQSRPQARFGVGKRALGGRPQKTNRSAAGRTNRGPRPPRPR